MQTAPHDARRARCEHEMIINTIPVCAKEKENGMKSLIMMLSWAILAGNFLWAQGQPGKIVLDSEGIELMPWARGALTANTYYDEDYAGTLPQHLVSLYENTFQYFLTVLSQHAMLNPPIGFDAHFDKRIQTWEKPSVPQFFFPDNDPKTAASIEISFAPLYRIGNAPQSDFHISSRVVVCLNNPYEIAGTPLMADIYPAPIPAGDFHGYPIYQTNRRKVTIINPGNKPLFIPVSRQDFIATVICYWEHQIDKDRADQNSYQHTRSSQNKETQKQQRAQEVERAYRELLKYDKQAAEELKKAFAETEHIGMDGKLDDSGITASQVFDNSVSFAHDQIMRLQDELKAMSQAEKQRQAIYSLSAFEDFNNVSGLLPLGDTSGDALVRINPDLVDENPHSIQLVSMAWYLMHSDFSDNPGDYTMSPEPEDIADKKMVTLYHDAALWRQFIHHLKSTPE